MQNKKITGLAVGGVILLILILWIFFSYNSLVKKEEKVKLQWSEVQSTYQRRLDLVPSLVNVVKGVSDFEQTTLEKITQARAKALSGLGNNELTAENFQNQKNLQDSLASAANRIIILIEKYPSLKGTAAYSGLQTQLEGTERRIKVARSDFNESVEKYNRKVRSFPSNIIAGLFGFEKKTGFEAAGEADRPVDIKFN